MTKKQLVLVKLLLVAVMAGPAFAQEKELKVQVSLKVIHAKLRQSGPGEFTAELTAKVRVANQGESPITLSEGGMQFFLFDNQDQLVEVRRERERMMDAAPLLANESGSREVRMLVPAGVAMKSEGTYRLVVFAYRTAGLNTFKFKK